jgi:hypothetical protein
MGGEVREQATTPEPKTLRLDQRREHNGQARLFASLRQAPRSALRLDSLPPVSTRCSPPRLSPVTLCWPSQSRGMQSPRQAARGKP